MQLLQPKTAESYSAETAAQNQLVASPRGPCKTNLRPPVVAVVVIQIASLAQCEARQNRAAGAEKHIVDVALGFSQRREVLPAETQVHREARLDLPIVLREE